MRRLALGLMGLGVVLTLVGVLGSLADSDDGDDTPAAPTTLTGPTETPDPTDPVPEPETPEEFYSRLERAFQEGDVDFMIERLHPEVVELYGEQQCRGFLDGQPPRTIEVVEIGETEPFDFGQRDDVDLVVDDTLVVTIRQSIEGADEPVESESHIVRTDDNTFRWFTDCGEPVP